MLTVVPPLRPRRVGELQVDLPVLPGLGAVLAVCRGLVCLVVDLRAEGVRELLRGTAALLAQVVALAEVLAQVLVVAGDGDRGDKRSYFSEERRGG